MVSTRLNSTVHLVDFKFGKTNAVVIALGPAPESELAQALKTKLAKAAAIYQNEPAVLDLSAWSDEDFKDTPLSLAAVNELTGHAGMNLIEVKSHHPAHEEECEALGIRHEVPLSLPQTEPVEPVQVEIDTTPPAPSPEQQLQASENNVRVEPTLSADTERKTLVVENPVRSGQRIYAPGADVVVLGQVSAGAEVIADGNVHIYGVLRGRALAGAAGDKKARILSTCFEAELVSIAGYYKTFEAGHPSEVRSQPTLIHLAEDERGSAVRLKPINIR